MCVCVLVCVFVLMFTFFPCLLNLWAGKELEHFSLGHFINAAINQLSVCHELIFNFCRAVFLFHFLSPPLLFPLSILLLLLIRPSAFLSHFFGCNLLTVCLKNECYLIFNFFSFFPVFFWLLFSSFIFF